MGFSCKIVLDNYTREDNTYRVILRVIIDRKIATVPLGFCLRKEDFDKRHQCVKPTHPNANDFNIEFLDAIAKANGIASKFRQQSKLLTPSEFRSSFENPPEVLDLIRFIQKEVILKRPNIANNTYKQHQTLINKLVSFRKHIPFSHVSIELVQLFKNHLKKGGNGGPTIEKHMKILKQYLDEARRKGHEFKDPFIKVKTFQSNRLALTETEVNILHNYYSSPTCPPDRKKLLRYFLFCCFTGVRISDIGELTWGNIHGDMLIFLPTKTKNTLKTVSVPLLDVDKRYLSERKAAGDRLFETFADQTSNRKLKDIARDLKINKSISFHTSRHTFASLLAEQGNIIALQRMMGHGAIQTSMAYVHTNTQMLVDAKTKRFGKIQQENMEPNL